MNKPINQIYAPITQIDSQKTLMERIRLALRDQTIRSEEDEIPCPAAGSPRVSPITLPSAPIDWELDGDGESFDRFLETILERIEASPNLASRKRGQFKKNLSLLVANLVGLELRTPGTRLAYSRDRSRYNARYLPEGIGYGPMMRAADSLIALGLAEGNTGYREWGALDDAGEEGWIGHQSRIWATQRLIDLFIETRVRPFSIGRTDYKRETIRLRNARKYPIGYKDTDAIRAMRELVERYNQELAVADIGLTPEGEARLSAKQAKYRGRKNLSLDNRFVYRVFSQSSFEKGGRFYGPWWQGVGKKIRREILIDDDVTIELDYSAQFPHLLYSMEGVDYASTFGATDYPYSVPGFEHLPIKFLKGVFIRYLNTSSWNEATLSIKKLANSKKYRKNRKIAAASHGAIFRAIRTKHRRIAHYFFKDVGTRLMNLDAQVTEEIIRRCLDARITVLTIHDSFIVSCENKEFLELTMREAWAAHGHCSVPNIKE